VPRFRYGEITVAAADPGEYFTTNTGETVRVQRRRDEEKRLVDSLGRFGFKPPPRGAIHATARCRTAASASRARPLGPLLRHYRTGAARQAGR